jgi:hypothetical protein
MGYTVGTGLNNALVYAQPRLPMSVVTAPVVASWTAPAIRYSVVPARASLQSTFVSPIQVPQPQRPIQHEVNIATDGNWPGKGFTGRLAGEPFALSYHWHFFSPDTITGTYANQPVSLSISIPFLTGPHIQGEMAGKAVDLRVNPNFLSGRSLVGTFMGEPLNLEISLPFLNDRRIIGSLGRVGIQITGQWGASPKKIDGTIGKATLKGALTGGWLQPYDFQGELSSPVPIPKSYGALWLLMVMMRNIDYRESRYSHPSIVSF